MLASLLSFRQGILTVGLRSIFVLSLVTILPYYAFSRRLFNLNDIKRSMFAYLLPMFILGALPGFEFIRHWKLYSLPGISHAAYLERAGALRASVTAGGPIILGYIMMVGIGFLLPLAKRSVTPRLVIQSPLEFYPVHRSLKTD